MRSPPPSSGSSCITSSSGDSGGGGSSPGSVTSLSFEAQRDLILDSIEQLVSRYNQCFLCLNDAIADLDSLRAENLNLTAENLHLAFLLADRDSSSANAVPKSISIRSPRFLSVKHPVPAAGGGGDAIRHPHRLRLPAPTARQGYQEEEVQSGTESVEVDVYEQGTSKTELCNKWGATGTCPYSDRCRFAHGIQELRPVMRHPRYKTQLCHMVHGCHYGHRCHFRHAALSELGNWSRGTICSLVARW